MRLTATLAAILALGGLAALGDLPVWQPLGALVFVLGVVWWGRMADWVFGEKL